MHKRHALLISVALLAATSLQAVDQDKPTEPQKVALGWKFQVGQTRELTWANQVKVETIPPLEGWLTVDASFEWSGTLTIDEVTADGSGVGKFTLHRQVWKGKFGDSSMDLLIVDS